MKILFITLFVLLLFFVFVFILLLRIEIRNKKKQREIIILSKNDVTQGLIKNIGIKN